MSSEWVIWMSSWPKDYIFTVGGTFLPVSYDINKLDLVYFKLDSLQSQNRLNEIQFAEVIVSLIQDIPYSLILSDACDANIYNDKFIKEYLNGDGNCLSNTRYGLLTPVEFMTTPDTESSFLKKG